MRLRLVRTGCARRPESRHPIPAPSRVSRRVLAHVARRRARQPVELHRAAARRRRRTSSPRSLRSAKASLSTLKRTVWLGSCTPSAASRSMQRVRRPVEALAALVARPQAEQHRLARLHEVLDRFDLGIVERVDARRDRFLADHVEDRMARHDEQIDVGQHALELGAQVGDAALLLQVLDVQLFLLVADLGELLGDLLQGLVVLLGGLIENFEPVGAVALGDLAHGRESAALSCGSSPAPPTPARSPPGWSARSRTSCSARRASVSVQIFCSRAISLFSSVTALTMRSKLSDWASRRSNLFSSWVKTAGSGRGPGPTSP